MKVVKYLLEKGGDVKAKDRYKETALIKAAFLGNLEVVKYLVEKGADVEAKDKYGRTALMNAAKNGKLEDLCMVLLASSGKRRKKYQCLASSQAHRGL